jgi:hypothetical protein
MAVVTSEQLFIFENSGRFKLKASFDKCGARIVQCSFVPHQATALILTETGTLLALGLPKCDVTGSWPLDLEPGFRALRRCVLHGASILRARNSNSLALDTVVFPSTTSAPTTVPAAAAAAKGKEKVKTAAAATTTTTTTTGVPSGITVLSLPPATFV